MEGIFALEVVRAGVGFVAACDDFARFDERGAFIHLGRLRSAAAMRMPSVDSRCGRRVGEYNLSCLRRLAPWMHDGGAEYCILYVVLVGVHAKICRGLQIMARIDRAETIAVHAAKCLASGGAANP